MLNWVYVTDPKSPEFQRKGARLAQAVYGWRSRFAIVELRKFGSEVEYAISDAEAQGDAWYAEGKPAPLLPERYDDPSDCVKLIDEWSDRRRAEWETLDD